MKKIDFLLLIIALIGVGVIVFALMYEIYRTNTIIVGLSHITYFMQT